MVVSASKRTHPVRLRGPRELVVDGEPMLLQRTEQEFIAALLEDLAQKDGLTEVAKTLAANVDAGSILQLYQPVHQVFHLVLVEAFCEKYDHDVLQPRLDPQRIESAGLVLRRVGEDPNILEGWRQAGARLRGWVPFVSSFESPSELTNSEPGELRKDLNLDPDPERRSPVLAAGNHEINHRLALLRSVTAPLTETTSPLFVAPPAVCEAMGKTLLYGLVPVTSSDISEVDITLSYDLDFVQNHLPTYFRAGGQRSIARSRDVLHPSDAKDPKLRDFILMVRQVQIELNAFGNTPAARNLLHSLNQIQLPLAEETQQPAGEFLEQAAVVLVNQAQNETIKMPMFWPAVSQSVADMILETAKAALDERLLDIAPRRGRFEDPDAHYRVRAFIRVQQPDGCPPKLVWSPYSQPFKILSWFENGPLPPIQVTLPDITRESVSKLKPNVVFAVPGNLFDLLQANQPSDFLDGEGKASESAGIALDWICSFNIPVITICAFIVLSIFLQLFNIIFWWLAFIRICIPFPFPKRS